MVTINALSLSLFVMLIFIYICDPFVVYLCLQRFRTEGQGGFLVKRLLKGNLKGLRGGKLFIRNLLKSINL